MDEGRRLILKDGTVIEGGEAGLSGGVLWLWLPGMTMMEAAAILFDKQKTAVIWAKYGEAEDEYKGYTNVTAMMEQDGRISAGMKRGA